MSKLRVGRRYNLRWKPCGTKRVMSFYVKVIELRLEADGEVVVKSERISRDGNSRGKSAYYCYTFESEGIWKEVVEDTKHGGLKDPAQIKPENLPAWYAREKGITTAPRSEK